MVTAVITLNIGLALLCLWAAWQLWRLGQTLRQLRWMLGDVARNTEAGLRGATDALVAGQQSTQRLRWRYRHANQQLRQLQRLLVWASWAEGWLRRSGPGDRTHSHRNH
ncbi:MAG: hypothetical protein HC824_12275 [Synechococcales cyanobacterium RM1_1_8]|nr:hypothetical protein [Synechococcales cyanobacterium RM1_1_8]